MDGHGNLSFCPQPVVGQSELHSPQIHRLEKSRSQLPMDLIERPKNSIGDVLVKEFAHGGLSPRSIPCHSADSADSAAIPRDPALFTNATHAKKAAPEPSDAARNNPRQDSIGQ